MLVAAVNAPWLWSDQERAQLRLEHARVTHKYNVDGGLFFPTELFRHLVWMSFVQMPEVYPRTIRHQSRDVLHTTADWEFFRSATHDFAQILRRERELDRFGGTPQMKRDVRDRECAAMAAAFRAVRAHFGRERFDRMLYEAASYSESLGNAETFRKKTEMALQTAQRCQ